MLQKTIVAYSLRLLNDLTHIGKSAFACLSHCVYYMNALPQQVGPTLLTLALVESV